MKEVHIKDIKRDNLIAMLTNIFIQLDEDAMFDITANKEHITIKI